MYRNWKQNGNRETQIRKEASSRTIEKTIKGVENALNIKIRRMGTPTQNREEMFYVLKAILRRR